MFEVYEVFFCFFIGKLMEIIFSVKTLVVLSLFSSCSPDWKSFVEGWNIPFFPPSFPPCVNYGPRSARLHYSFIYLPRWGISVTHVARYGVLVVALSRGKRLTMNEQINGLAKKRRKLYSKLYSLPLLLQRKWTIKLFEATMTMGRDGTRRGGERERISIPHFRRHENKFDSVEK